MAKRKKKVRVEADHGPAERQQHGDYVEADTERAGIKKLRNTTVDPISTYYNRKLISQVQFAAAENFAAHFRLAGLSAHYATMRFDENPGIVPTVDAQIKMQSAKQHIRDAVAFVGFPLSRIIEHVVGHCENAGSWEGVKDSKKRQSDGMAALRLALDGLVQYYKL